MEKEKIDIFDYYTLKDLYLKLENFDNKLIIEELISSGKLNESSQLDQLSRKFYECAAQDTKNFRKSYDITKNVYELEKEYFNSFNKDLLMETMLIINQEKLIDKDKTVGETLENISKEFEERGVDFGKDFEDLIEITNFDYFKALAIKNNIDITTNDMDEVLDNWFEVIYEPTKTLNIFANYENKNFIKAFNEVSKDYKEHPNPELNFQKIVDYDNSKLLDKILFYSVYDFSKEFDNDIDLVKKETQKIIDNYCERAMSNLMFKLQDNTKVLDTKGKEVIEGNFNNLFNYMKGKNEIFRIFDLKENIENKNETLNEISKLTKEKGKTIDAFFEIPEVKDAFVKFKSNLPIEAKIKAEDLQTISNKLLEIRNNLIKIGNPSISNKDKIQFRKENTIFYLENNNLKIITENPKDFSLDSLKDIAKTNNLDITFSIYKNNQISESVTLKNENNEIKISGNVNKLNTNQNKQKKSEQR